MVQRRNRGFHRGGGGLNVGRKAGVGIFFNSLYHFMHLNPSRYNGESKPSKCGSLIYARQGYPTLFVPSCVALSYMWTRWLLLTHV